MMYVHPQFQGLGVASLLLKSVESGAGLTLIPPKPARQRAHSSKIEALSWWLRRKFKGVDRC